MLSLLICAFCASHKQKKQIIESTACLEKAIPFTIHILFFFLTIIIYFLCELTCMSYLLVINQLYFLYFSGLICLCKQSTCMMGVGSTLASTGDHFFYFSVRKDKRQWKVRKVNTTLSWWSSCKLCKMPMVIVYLSHLLPSMQVWVTADTSDRCWHWCSRSGDKDATQAQPCVELTVWRLGGWP